MSGLSQTRQHEAALRKLSSGSTGRYRCLLCSYSTMRRYNARRHFEDVHEKKNNQIVWNNFVCCGTIFSSGISLQHHNDLVHKFGYSCKVCGVVFVRRAELLGHIDTHTGERNFICEMCPYSGTTKSNLKRHVERMHGMNLCRRKADSPTNFQASSPSSSSSCEWNADCVVDQSRSSSPSAESSGQSDDVGNRLVFLASKHTDEIDYSSFRPKRLCTPQDWRNRRLRQDVHKDELDAATSLLLLHRFN